MASLPRIDLADSSAVSALRDACGPSGAGFFYLKMTAEERSAAAKALEASKRLFALPLEEKLKFGVGPDTFYKVRGQAIPGTGPGYRALAKDPNFATDSRESFNIGRNTANDENPVHGANPWPCEIDVPGLRHACDIYATLLCEKSCLLRRAVAEALHMPPSHFDAPGLFDRSTWLLGFVHYHPTASRPEQNFYGIKPHQDDGIFTLLHTDGSAGLQICPDWKGSGVHREEAMLDNSLAWQDVEHVPDHWVVNLGTLLQRWSNGRFKATLHRVVTDGQYHRYSVPFFYEPNIDAPIECLPSCLRPEETALPSTTPGDIMLEMAAQDGLLALPVAEEPTLIQKSRL